VKDARHTKINVVSPFILGTSNSTFKDEERKSVGGWGAEGGGGGQRGEMTQIMYAHMNK
jgi:hypothetical protein